MPISYAPVVLGLTICESSSRWGSKISPWGTIFFRVGVKTFAWELKRGKFPRAGSSLQLHLLTTAPRYFHEQKAYIFGSQSASPWEQLVPGVTSESILLIQYQ